MPNRPNEFPPPPRDVPEWAEYQPGMANQYGGRVAQPSPYSGHQQVGQRGQSPTGAPGAHPNTQPSYVPLPTGVVQPSYYQPAPSYGNQPISYAPAFPVAPPTNGYAITSLVLGIMAAMYSVTMIGGVVLGPAAIIFGMVGLGRTKASGDRGRAVALWGIWTGVAGTSIGLLMIGAVTTMFSSSKEYELHPEHMYQEYDAEQEDDSYHYSGESDPIQVF